MDELTGKWVMVKGQPFPGLWFEFFTDGNFRAELPGLIKVKSSGTYQTGPNGQIDIHQQEHSMGLIGHFAGRFEVEGDTLRMALAAAPGGPRPETLTEARVYQRAE